MGEEFVIQSTATETHQPISPNLMGQTQDKQKTFAPAVPQSRGNAANGKHPSAAPSYLSINFGKEVKKLLLEVRRERIKGSGVYQGSQVCIDKNGTRCFKVDILTSVSFHLPCSLRAGK